MIVSDLKMKRLNRSVGHKEKNKIERGQKTMSVNDSLISRKLTASSFCTTSHFEKGQAIRFVRSLAAVFKA
jgi:hypothetical protein